MNTLQKVRAVEKLFGKLEKNVQKLKNNTGIHCIENCVHCCTTPRIQATSLEFYPLAYHLYKTGKAEAIIHTIEQINNPAICPVLNHLSLDGRRSGCENYEHRGLICRLFAYNHATDKYDRRRLSACKPIRLVQAQELERANEILRKKVLGPKASAYYSRLQFIDFNEAQRLYPIGQAIKTALESIVTYFHYSGKKAM
ncbi:MAG TPA: YkgJ family cysteine cluster protein [Draconibacterium sp.]|nr:YkgJ family cysteine cluster protein [Draconibacterium sp.]